MTHKLADNIGFIFLSNYFRTRTSTKEQNEQRQFNKMIDKSVEARRIFVDKASGKDFDRQQYQILRKVLAEGDIVYIDALDCMGRNYRWSNIGVEIHHTKAAGNIIVLENSTLFDSLEFGEMGDMGLLMEDQFLLQLSYVADQERKKIRQRQAKGIAHRENI